MRKNDLVVIEKKALEIATKAHKGQVDKAGVDYIEHPKAVARRCSTAEGRIAALLHDTIEDTEVSAEELIESGIPEEIVKAVVLVTKDRKDPDYSYETYLKRIKENPIARMVKMADLLHNMDLSRLPVISMKEMMRYFKYQISYDYLAS